MLKKREIAETFKSKAGMVKTEERNEAETVPSRKAETQKTILLSDNSKITKLNIDNEWLTRLYGEAYSKAIVTYRDAQLRCLSIQVFPFTQLGSRVNIYLDFYSKWADRVCGFVYREDDQQVKQIEDVPLRKNDRRDVFAILPWIKNPDWMEFLNLAYAKIGRLSEREANGYHLMATPPREEYGKWTVIFDCDLSGLRRSFDWNGRGLDHPEQNIRESD